MLNRIRPSKTAIRKEKKIVLTSRIQILVVSCWCRSSWNNNLKLVKGTGACISSMMWPRHKFQTKAVHMLFSYPFTGWRLDNLIPSSHWCQPIRNNSLTFCWVTETGHISDVFKYSWHTFHDKTDQHVIGISFALCYILWWWVRLHLICVPFFHHIKLYGAGYGVPYLRGPCVLIIWKTITVTILHRCKVVYKGNLRFLMTPFPQMLPWQST